MAPRKGKRKMAAAGAVAVLLVVAAVVFVWAQPKQGGGPFSACVMVIDRTDSSSDAPTIAAYRTAAQQVIDGCAELSADLTIYFFDQSNLKLVVVNEEPYKLYLPASKDPAQLARAQPELDATVTEAKAAVDAVLDLDTNDDARDSDILSALKSASQGVQVLMATPGVKNGFLVFLTDGIQLGTDISFTALADDPSTVPSLVERAAELGEIPVLNGVKVNFVGVRAGRIGDGTQIPEWFEAAAEQFWRTVVERGGGKLCLYAASAPKLPVDC